LTSFVGSRVGVILGGAADIFISFSAGPGPAAAGASTNLTGALATIAEVDGILSGGAGDLQIPLDYPSCRAGSVDCVALRSSVAPATFDIVVFVNGAPTVTAGPALVAGAITIITIGTAFAAGDNVRVALRPSVMPAGSDLTMMVDLLLS